MLKSSKENKALFRRANEAINRKDLTVLDKFAHHCKRAASKTQKS